MTWTPTGTSVGTSSNIDTAWMGINNNGRKAMGTSALSEFKSASASAASPLKTVRLAGTAPGGPAPKMPPVKRNKIINENLGASLVPSATRPAASAESQKTMANTKWVMQSHGTNDNFRSV